MILQIDTSKLTEVDIKILSLLANKDRNDKQKEYRKSNKQSSKDDKASSKRNKIQFDGERQNNDGINNTVPKEYDYETILNKNNGETIMADMLYEQLAKHGTRGKTLDELVTLVKRRGVNVDISISTDDAFYKWWDEVDEKGDWTIAQAYNRYRKQLSRLP